MTVKTRALIIGMAGPAIQMVGIAWVVIHLLLRHVEHAITARHIIFETPFLIVFVRFLVSIVCIPVALEVARATLEDVAIPVFGPADNEQVELQDETAR